MKFKNRWLASASILAIFTAFLHLIGGTLEVHMPLLNSNILENEKILLYVCWHLVSITLLWSAYEFSKNSIHEMDQKISCYVLLRISYLWIFFGVGFIVISSLCAGPKMILLLPQWILLIPVGLCGIVGVKRVNSF